MENINIQTQTLNLYSMKSNLFLYITGITVAIALSASVLRMANGEEFIWSVLTMMWATDSFFLQLGNKTSKTNQ